MPPSMTLAGIATERLRVVSTDHRHGLGLSVQVSGSTRCAATVSGGGQREDDREGCVSVAAVTDRARLRTLPRGGRRGRAQRSATPGAGAHRVPHVTGEALSRQELAELVNAWVFEHQARVIELDANYIGKLEQGTIRWPREPDRRTAFRAVLGVDTDAELGFRCPRRSRTTVAEMDRQQFLRAGLGATVAAAAGQSALAELITPTQPTLVPSVVGLDEVAGVRTAATAFAGWDARYGGGLVRQAVNANCATAPSC